MLVFIVSLVSHYAQGWISEDNLMLYYLVSVIVAALYWGVGPALLVSVLSFLALDFGVFQPRLRLNTPDLQYFLSLVTFVGVGYVISRLSNRLRTQAHEAEQRAQVSLELQQFGRDLTHLQTQDEVVRAFEEHAGRLFGGGVRLILGGEQLCSVGGELPEDHDELLSSFSQQAQLALQRVHSENELRQAMLVAERERVQNALLNSLSHDLQTPLASVAGSLQVATDPSITLEPDVRRGLLQLAGEQTERLRRLVSNLLQMTRLDGPGLVLNRQSVEVDELIGVVLDQGPRTLRDRITTNLDAGLAELDIDYVLVVNLLLNLLENAHKYTPEGTPVEMHACQDENRIRFDVRDRGPGIPPEDIPRIFDKFYRAKGLELSGSGLGLFIAKGIVDAHQGKIQARLREGGGLEISCWLPCAGS
ncbi:DUF4118 domain-containing protein [bacterium]|nr:DUF4118 domain-containing protein [bacterium]